MKRIGELEPHADGLSLTIRLSGASLEINRIYKVVLTFSTGLQLTFLCAIAAMGLWVDLQMRVNTPGTPPCTRLPRSSYALYVQLFAW